MSGQTPSVFDFIDPTFLSSTYADVKSRVTRFKELEAHPPNQSAVVWNAMDDVRRVILFGDRRAFNCDQLANFIGFQNNLAMRETEIRKTRLGNAIYASDMTVPWVLKRYEPELPTIIAGGGPVATERLIGQLTAFCHLTRNSQPVFFEDLQTGLAALGTAIATSRDCAVEKVTPDLFRQLLITIPLLIENRDKPFKEKISISREQAVSWKNTGDVTVVDPEDFSEKPFDIQLHNDPKFTFRTSINDKRGEPVRAQATDALTEIVGSHPWMGRLVRGKELSWVGVKSMRAEKAATEAAIFEAGAASVKPAVATPFVLADRFIDTAQSVTAGEPEANTRVARVGLRQRFMGALFGASQRRATS